MRLKLVCAALIVSGIASVSEGYTKADPVLPITSVLFAERDVAKGAVISASDLRVHWIERGKKPIGSFDTIFQAVGLKTKFGLVEGQIVSNSDVVFQENTTLVAVRLNNTVAQKLQKVSLQKKISQSQLCESALTQYLSKKK